LIKKSPKITDTIENKQEKRNKMAHKCATDIICSICNVDKKFLKTSIDS